VAEQRPVQLHHTNIETSDVEPDPTALVTSTDPDVEEAGAVAEGHLAAGVDLVGPDPEMCFGHR
jgi:hypothetical protein